MKFSLALLIVAAFGAAQGGIITGPLLSMVAVSKGANKIVKGVTGAGSAVLGIGGSGSAGVSASAAASSSTGVSAAGESTGAASADASDEGSTSSGLGGLVGKVNGAISSAAGTVFDSAANVADQTTQTWNEGVEKLTETAQAPLEAGQTLIKEVQNKLDVIPVVGTLAKPLTIIGAGKLGLASSAVGALGNAEQGKMNLINAGLQGGLAAGKGIVNAATSLSTNVAGGLSGAAGAKGSGGFGVKLFGR